MNLDHARRADSPDAIAPDGSEIRLLLNHDAGSMCEVRLPPGGVSLPVRHRTVQELWYCLEGEGEVMRAPCCIRIGSGVNMRNRSHGGVMTSRFSASAKKANPASAG